MTDTKRFQTPTPCAIILAAGQGVRMRSKKPKVLCEILFTPMLQYVVDACRAANVMEICVVTGYEDQQVRTFLTEQYPHDSITTVRQPVQKGTGHAVQMAISFLEGYRGEDVCILYGDAPCMTAEELSLAHHQHRTLGSAATVVSAAIEDPTGYGRIVREKGALAQIVEEKDATEAQRAICEVNAGVYWFAVDDLLSVLNDLTPQNESGEYYLTDVIDLLRQAGKRVDLYESSDPQIVTGINSRAQQLALNERLRKQELARQCENGVEFLSTDGVVIAANTPIGADTVILPGTIIGSGVTIGEGCTIGPNTFVADSVIGNRVSLNNVQCRSSKIHDDVDIGPFSQLRPGCEIKSTVHIGDFVEIKNSTIGEGSGISHLTYIGDSDVGKNVNVGCGVVTVNYDGVKKDRCVIEDDAFVGCNTNLIAPVRVGEGAYTAAGSTITEDVPAWALALARARQTNKEDHAKKLQQGRKKKYVEQLMEELAAENDTVEAELPSAES